MTTEPGPDVLAATQAVADNLLVYCRGIDRCDVELVKQAFWPDAYDNHGADAAPAHEFADRIVAAKLAGTAWTTHAVTNHLVEVDGDVAFSEATVLTFQRANGSDRTDVFCGRYVDRVERRGGDWRIAYRQMVHDWSGSTVLEPWALPGVASGAFVQGARGSADFVTGRGREDLMADRLPRS
ncbi:nuclear transport factor 2 family protein [Pseudonocardia sp. C8]|uniref:nuclear transport factor 2 family protein n=1 Tax=Pseudonocardia sp. C8 TaxID=2762759 RepID=UPI0016433A31|nr:nuclear transport factor 2 family protein [Pseudonocardia sp. C8]MBC3191741.1 nuclear transport factor 2 family protein [Pseudonocardia sp. C8]